MASSSGPLVHSTLAGMVHERLRDLIASGELAPGERLVIGQLAKQFGVSITPVREALRWLQRDGLVADTSYQGMSVTKASDERLRELFEIRGVLEGYAMAQATQVMTEDDIAAGQDLYDAMSEAIEVGDGTAFRKLNLEFHTHMLGKATSTVLKKKIADLTNDLERYRRPQFTSSAEYMQDAQRQHLELLTMVRERRVDSIERATREHALLFVNQLLRQRGVSTDEAD